MKRLLAASLLLTVVCLGCRRANVHLVHGVVREVLPDERQAVIEHEDIPGLMSAMTMSFDVPDPDVLAQLEPGEKILFELEASASGFRIVGVRSEGRAGAARSPSVASVARAGDTAPDFALTDQSGARVASRDLRGRLALVDFVYTRCNGPCPILTSLHVELQRALPPELRERVRFVSISLDPEYDTPERLERYARDRGADLSSWSFLTGPPAEVADVVKRYGVGTLRAADGTIDHVVATFLLDEQGRIAKRWLGLEHGVGERRDEIAAVAGAAAASGS